MPAGPVKSVHGAFAIPSLDGIRAAAVLIVFIGHGKTIGGPWPGDVGVTIFFFLSGYLITTLLRREYDRNGRISLGKFYLRRLLRIQPPRAHLDHAMRDRWRSRATAIDDEHLGHTR
ncbi:acyltransferase family protein [Microbacterium paulum]